MMRLVSICAGLSLLAACNGSGPDPVAEDTVTTPAETESEAPEPTPPGPADAANGGARVVSEETDDFVFDYSYPAEAGAIPELAALLDSRLDAAQTEIAEESARARAQARDNGFPYNKYSSGIEWKRVADLPGWLSLSGLTTSYTGGAHGMYGVVSLLWDKHAGEALTGEEMFTSPAALGEALGDRFCEGLDKLRAERREAPVPEDDDPAGFNECPEIDELTVLLGSANGQTFDRMTLYAGPYVAGPYVEGAYEVHLPIDAAVIEVVKPEYRESFSTRN